MARDRPAAGTGCGHPARRGLRGARGQPRAPAFVTEELAPTASLEDDCRDWPADPPLKRALIARVAEMARRMHEGGVNHRDFYPCHFLLHLDPPTPQQLRLSIIDLHRAQLRARSPRRWRNKDLAGLYFSTLRVGLARRDRLRFLRVYFPARCAPHSPARRACSPGCSERKGGHLMARFERKYGGGARR